MGEFVGHDDAVGGRRQRLAGEGKKPLFVLVVERTDLFAQQIQVRPL